MNQYCVFLRGINVNGIKIKMKDLVSGMKVLGYEQVETVLATGNIIIGLDQPITNLYEFRLKLEKQLSEHFKYEAFVFIRDIEWFDQQLKAFSQIDPPDNHHIYCLILDSNATKEELINEFNQLDHGEFESLSQSNNDILWLVEKGFTLLSPFGKKALGKKYFKDKLTSRNANTINKIYNKMK